MKKANHKKNQKSTPQTCPTQRPYTDIQDEPEAATFHPLPKELSSKTTPQLFLLHGTILGVGFIIALFSAFFADNFAFSKEPWWPHVSYAASVTPWLVTFFDYANICFPIGDTDYTVLAETLKASGGIKATRLICGGMFIGIILCEIDYILKYGLNEQTISAGLGAIALAWFITGIVRFIRFR